jgi:hypothetical protein
MRNQMKSEVNRRMQVVVLKQAYTSDQSVQRTIATSEKRNPVIRKRSSSYVYAAHL